MSYNPEIIKDEIAFKYITFDDFPDLSFNTCYGKYAETDTQKMVINRINRIKYCNLEIFKDDNDEGFKKWLKFKHQPLLSISENCICSMELNKECFYIKRQHPISHEWYAMRIGSSCEKKLHSYYGTKSDNSLLKKCRCGKRKNIKETFCKKCIEKNELEKKQKEKMKRFTEILEKKIESCPYNKFYISLNHQYKTKGFLTDNQIKCLCK